jgi:hypothetical protein
VFRMWYSFAKPDYQIRYAESLDGIAWERAPIDPVLGPSPKPGWDDTMVEYPEIQIVDGVYRMWFCGNGYGSVGYAQGIPETGVDVSIRSGAKGTPDESWSNWQPCVRGQSINVNRFAQLRAQLWSRDSALSPTLNELNLRP